MDSKSGKSDFQDEVHPVPAPRTKFPPPHHRPGSPPAIAIPTTSKTGPQSPPSAVDIPSLSSQMERPVSVIRGGVDSYGQDILRSGFSSSCSIQRKEDHHGPEWEKTPSEIVSEEVPEINTEDEQSSQWDSSSLLPM